MYILQNMADQHRCCWRIMVEKREDGIDAWSAIASYAKWLLGATTPKLSSLSQRKARSSVREGQITPTSIHDSRTPQTNRPIATTEYRRLHNDILLDRVVEYCRAQKCRTRPGDECSLLVHRVRRAILKNSNLSSTL